jgi:hypothetical protein
MNASFPTWLSIENKDNSVFVDLILAIECSQFSLNVLEDLNSVQSGVHLRLWRHRPKRTRIDVVIEC